MTKVLYIFTGIAFLLMADIAVAQQQAVKRIAAIGPLSATVQVTELRSNEYEVHVDFHSAEPSKYPAGCLSAYRDFRFTLYDSVGRTVAIDQSVLANPPSEIKSVSGLSTYSARHRPINCASLGMQNGGGYALLSKLYPHLAAGKYILQLTFVPRILRDQRPLLPIQITIKQ